MAMGTIAEYWYYIVVIPAGYLVRMVLGNNKEIQQLKQELEEHMAIDAREHKYILEKLEDISTPIEESVQRIDKRMTDIDKKMDQVILHVSKK